MTEYGRMHGELILSNVPLKKGESQGIECIARGVVICKTTFGLDVPLFSRLKGSISADFLPITSDRSRFIIDTPEYVACVHALERQLQALHRIVQDALEKKLQQEADDTLKDTLSRMRRAIRKNPDIAPPLLSADGILGEDGKQRSMFSPPTQGADAVEALHMNISKPITLELGHNEFLSLDDPTLVPPKKVRVKNITGKTILARSITVGGIGITCALDHFGKHERAAYTEAGIVYINMDHPLYCKQLERGKEALGFLLMYLLAQQVAILLSEGDTRRAFDMQDRLLTYS